MSRGLSHYNARRGTKPRFCCITARKRPSVAVCSIRRTAASIASNYGRRPDVAVGEQSKQHSVDAPHLSAGGCADCSDNDHGPAGIFCGRSRGRHAGPGSADCRLVHNDRVGRRCVLSSGVAPDRRTDTAIRRRALAVQRAVGRYAQADRGMGARARVQRRQLCGMS